MIKLGNSWLGRLLRKWLLVLVLTYAFVLIMLVFLENRMVYPRETATDRWQNPPQPGATEVLVICHGNGGNLSYRGNTLIRFREVLGCSVLIFDYPGYGKCEGKPTEENCYASAEAAFRWLNEIKGYPSQQVILFGESLGGGVAVEIAKRQPCRALVLFKTFTSLPAVAAGPKEFLALEGERHNDRLTDDFMMNLKRFMGQIR
ncbi:MAG: alpha/beta fold hydrolase [Planctomycetes bacterium]|nr:alpha/beta fold hydrolase [Planctomycetota bacterium]